jgi:hypothetical protein
MALYISKSNGSKMKKQKSNLVYFKNISKEVSNISNMNLLCNVIFHLLIRVHAKK